MNFWKTMSSLDIRGCHLPGIGVFGGGKSVKLVVPQLRSKGFKIEALWSRNADKAKETAKELAIPFHTSNADEVLLRKNVSLVVIICEPHLHSSIAVKALGIGKHVLCDRPAGLNVADVFKMVQAAQYYPSLIAIVSHSMRFLPTFVRMKRQVAEGYVGKIQVIETRIRCSRLSLESYSWLDDSHLGGGALANLGGHLIDIISFVTNSRAVRVLGTLKTLAQVSDKFHQPAADDLCIFTMEMDNGATASVNINTMFAGQYTEEVTICGTGGSMVARAGDLYGQKTGSLKEEVLYLDVEDLKQSPSILPRNLSDLSKEKLVDKMHPPHLPKSHVKGWDKLVCSLRDAFVSKGNTKQVWEKESVASAATFEDALYVQAVVDAIRQSWRDKQWTCVFGEHMANSGFDYNSYTRFQNGSHRPNGFSL